jgi:purine-binding chemotaxis protein CheW
MNIETALAEGQADSGELRQYLTFMLGTEQFAIGILCVKEIIEYGHLTTVPMMPSSIRGVINLRGAVVPVIDLAARFGRAATPITRRTCIVIVEMQLDDDHLVVGVVVDAVNEVIDIAAQDIEPPPSFGARMRTDFILGMAKVSEKFVILLDVNRVLGVHELEQLDELKPVVSPQA